MPGDVEQMRATYADFSPMIRKILSKVTSCLRWTLADLPLLESWLWKSGKVVLVWDAADAMVPSLAQGASMSIEDGACLAECLGRVKTPGEVPRYLGVFEIYASLVAKESSWVLGQMETCGSFRTVQSRSCQTVL